MFLWRKKIGWPIIILSLFLSTGLFSCAPVEMARSVVTDRFFNEQQLDDALEVVEDFFEAIMDEDYPAAYALISHKDQQENSYEDFLDEFRDVTSIVSIKMNWVEVKNNVAVVNIDFVDSYDGTQKTYRDLEVSLVKEENGSWKINFWP